MYYKQIKPAPAVSNKMTKEVAINSVKLEVKFTVYKTELSLQSIRVVDLDIEVLDLLSESQLQLIVRKL